MMQDTALHEETNINLQRSSSTTKVTVRTRVVVTHQTKAKMHFTMGGVHHADARVSNTLLAKPVFGVSTTTNFGGSSLIRYCDKMAIDQGYISCCGAVHLISEG
jgi:hypothetical protein